MKKHFLTNIAILLLIFCHSQLSAQIHLYTEDLPRFYQAFDSVLTTTDSLKQLDFIKQFYENKASKGLKRFMELRGGNAVSWQKFMLKKTKDLEQKRSWILSVLDQKNEIKKKIKRFKKLYSDFREGDIYFCVGINNSGGTVYDNTVYVGTEVLAKNQKNWAVPIILHEFAHTQQWVQRNRDKIETDKSFLDEYRQTHTQLLGQCLSEGMADFISELVLGKNLAQIDPNSYTAFGLTHEKQIWELFKKDMFLKAKETSGWLYSQKEINEQKVRDLGYFVGHQICKSFYNNAKNKKQALKEMLSMNITDENAKKFLIESGYLNQEEIDNLK